MSNYLWNTNYPRKLTNREIDDIINVLPLPNAMGTKNQQKIAEAIKDYLRESLITFEITPLAIDDLKHEFLTFYRNAIPPPGEALGIIAANSIGQPLMQLVLDSFHSSGSGLNVATGYESVANLLQGLQKVNNPSTTIFFNERLSFHEVFSMRKKYVEISVWDMIALNLQQVKAYELESPSEIIGDTVPHWYRDFTTWYIDNPIDERNLEPDMLGIPNKPERINDYPYMLRLHIDVSQMVKYGVTGEDIYNVIRSYKEIEHKEMSVIFSPIMSVFEEGETFNRVYIDIFPDKDNIKEVGSKLPEEEKVRFFLYKTVYGSTQDMIIQGITGIKDIEPTDQPVWSIVYNTYPLNNGNWMIQFNPRVMNETGLTREDFINLVQYMNIDIIPDDRLTDKFIILRTNKPTDYDSVMKVNKSKSNILPTDIYSYYKKLDDDDKEEYEEQQNKEGSSLIIRPPSDFEKLSVIYFARTNGNNLLNIISRPEVDDEHTYSNDINEMLSLYGIEVVRNFIIMRMNDIFETSGQYVDPRHIILISDFMTHIGTIIYFSFNGSSELDDGVITQATFQRAGEIIFGASGMKTEEDINRISNRTILSQAPNLSVEKLTERFGVEAMQQVKDIYGTPANPKTLQVSTENMDSAFDDDDDDIFGTNNYVIADNDLDLDEFENQYDETYEELVGEMVAEEEISSQLEQFTQISRRSDITGPKNPLDNIATTENTTVKDAMFGKSSAFSNSSSLTQSSTQITSIRPRYQSDPVISSDSSGTPYPQMWSTGSRAPRYIPGITSTISVPKLNDILQEGSETDTIKFFQY